MVHVFSKNRSVSGPPPGQSMVHLPFRPIKIVVSEESWQVRRDVAVARIYGLLGLQDADRCPWASARLRK